MELLSIVVFSIVEGISEFLPISSTGHLVLTAKLLQINQTDFVNSFLIAIQFGAITAVVVHSSGSILKNTSLFFKIVAGFVPTGIIGFFLYPFVKSFLLENQILTLLMLFLGGVVLMFIEKVKYIKDSNNINLNNITYTKCILIGIIQSISIIPGVSRSASSIIGGMLAGLDKKSSVEFSFLLAIPTMLAATGFDLIKNREILSNSSQMADLAIGVALSFAVALISIKWLLKYLENHSFFAFGVYRVIFSIIFALLLYHNLFI